MGSKTTQTTNASPYAPAKPLINEGLAAAGELYGQGGFQVNPYQGDMVAGFDPLRQSAVDQAPGVVANNLSGIQQAQTAAISAMDATVPDAVKQNVIAGIMPSINSSFAGSGMTGSSLHAQNLGKGLSAGLADVEDQYRTRALQAGQNLTGLGTAANQQLGYLDALGQGSQQQAQNVIEADVLRDQQAQSAEANAIQNYLALTTGAGSQFGVQSSTQKQNPGLLGTVGAGLQIGGLLSDWRVKENIRRVGKTDGGLPVYVYNYIGSDVMQMGVMAQEVEAVNPAAVVTRDNGLKAVLYGEVR